MNYYGPNYLTRTAYDVAALSAELLPTFKAHARIDNTDDDQLATLTLARAIAQLERQFGIAIAPQEWEWVGYPLAWIGPIPTRRRVPIKNVTAIEVTVGGVDQSANYTYYPPEEITGEGWLMNSAGYDADVPYLVVAGYETADDVDPALLDLILRYASYLWEQRESASEQNLNDVPDFINRAWATFWVPRL